MNKEYIMKKNLIYLLVLSLLTACSNDLKNYKHEMESTNIVYEQIKKSKNNNHFRDQSKWINVIDEVKLPQSLYESLYEEKWMMVIYTNGDNFENWFNSNYYLKPSLKNLEINLSSKDAERVNEDINRIYEEYINLPFGVHYQDYQSFENDRYLSIIRKYGVFLPGSTYESYMNIYNFDLTTGKLLNNQEILDIYHLSLDDIINYFENYYESIGSQPCKQGELTIDDLPIEVSQHCHGFTRENANVENLQMFIDENENLIIMNRHSTANEDRYLSTAFKYNFGLPK